MSELQVVDLPADRLAGEAVAAFFFEDERPLRGPAAMLDWRLNGLLTRMLLEGRVSGKAGEHVLVSNNGKIKAEWVLFIGGGSLQGFGRETYRGLIRHLFETCRQAGIHRLGACLAQVEGLDRAGLRQLVLELFEALEDKTLECSVSFQATGH